MSGDLKTSRPLPTGVRALVVGRFQPFHKGHLALVRHAVERYGEAVVAIGSAEQSHSFENPFTAGERYEMVREAAREAGILDRVLVVCVPDVNRNAIWAGHVRSLCPPFDVVLTNNALPRLLFEDAGVKVEGFPLVERDRYEGTRLRAAMREGGAWKDAVPPAVARCIERFDGPGRLRALAATDATANPVLREEIGRADERGARGR